MGSEGKTQNPLDREANVRFRRDSSHVSSVPSQSDRRQETIPVLFRLKNLNSPPLSDAEKATKALEDIAIPSKQAAVTSAPVSSVKKPLMLETIPVHEYPKSNLEHAVVKTAKHSGIRKVFLFSCIAVAAYAFYANQRPKHPIAKTDASSETLAEDIMLPKWLLVQPRR